MHHPVLCPITPQGAKFGRFTHHARNLGLITHDETPVPHPVLHSVKMLQGWYRSWKTWKVMEFKNFIFKAWKVMKFNFLSLKAMEN